MTRILILGFEIPNTSVSHMELGSKNLLIDQNWLKKCITVILTLKKGFELDIWKLLTNILR